MVASTSNSSTSYVIPKNVSVVSFVNISAPIQKPVNQFLQKPDPDGPG